MISIDAMRCEDCGGKPEVFAPGRAAMIVGRMAVTREIADRCWCLACASPRCPSDENISATLNKSVAPSP